MKKTEFFIEFAKALKSKDDVAILHFLISDPYSARTCLGNPGLQVDYDKWKTGNSFICRMLTENRIDEDISIAHNIFRETIDKRSFGTGAFPNDAHAHVDFFSRWRGFIQTKNKSVYTFGRLFDDWPHYTKNNQATVDCVDIFTRNNKMQAFDHTKIEKPKFNIVLFNNLKPINHYEIEEVQSAFYKNESSIIEIQETKMKPLVRAHKSFIENLEGSKFNHNNTAKEVLACNWDNFRRAKIIEY